MTDLKDTLAALLPCPFCGGEAAVYHHKPAGIEPSWHVECADPDGGDEGCGCGTCHHESAAEAIAAWNTRTGQLVPVPSVEVVARFQIGERVSIIAPEWKDEPPHYITGIDWHPKHGITYTTSEVWPPKVGGFHVEGLTDGWRDEDLSPAAAMKGEGRGDA